MLQEESLSEMCFLPQAYFFNISQLRQSLALIERKTLCNMCDTEIKDFNTVHLKLPLCQWRILEGEGISYGGIMQKLYLHTVNIMQQHSALGTIYG